ncbi:hypothetical protein DPMN_188602 [Dreissena polymorpha]|uniref:Uncharacterized protein n=1 Tax=Dreissena polymorpha TaxID=45954 RepID=A0A9D4DRX7_DREPO|nr:hypothetical protein DPMN_188602 [Dreissena polymorpha]
MGETCSKTIILSVVVAVLVLVLAAVVAAFIYRETSSRSKRTELNENTVQDLYPAFFRSQEEQRVFNASFQQSFYFNRTVIQPTVKSTQSCSFTCVNPAPARRKRQSTIGVQHGCCTSSVAFHAPPNHPNIQGQIRTFLQYESKKQFFTVHSCTALIGCTGCVCSQENNVAPAVVVKFGVQEVDDLQDTEIDYFYFAGCCKCVND